MPSWDIPFQILIVLAAALLLGTLAEQVRQSAILGYLLAGTLVGPHVLGLVEQAEHVRIIAELGVALLLFTIGLEFSFRRLRRIQRIVLLGGTLQVGLTMAAGLIVSLILGLEMRAAVAVGAIVALSSTACVLRLLIDRGVIDSIYGRNAIGILLLQDLAVIPLLLVVVGLSSGGTALEITVTLGKVTGLAVALLVGFVVVFKWIVPRILDLDRWSRNRELPILFTIVLALGSAYGAHAVSLSPAIGAFVAGVLLGESPFAAQIRADIGALRTLLVTLFFASIGMLGDPAWAVHHWYLVIGAVVLIMGGKLLITWSVVRMIGFTHGIAFATALCLAQVGEFSFVIAETARGHGSLISADLFNVIVSATIATLFLTPFLIAVAPRAGAIVESFRRRTAPLITPTEPGASATSTGESPDLVIVGFGPAGQAIAHLLYERRDRIAVIELNGRTAREVERLGITVHRGDATHREVLEHAGVPRARVIAITVPDVQAVRSVIHLCRSLAPEATILARARYHLQRWEIELAGAHVVVDEEQQVGRRMAAVVRRSLRRSPQ